MIDHFWKVFPRDAEFAWSPAPSDREQDVASPVHVPGGCHLEPTVALVNPFQTLAGSDLYTTPLLCLVPEFEQRFLGRLSKGNLTDDGQDRGSRHDDLAARIVSDCPSKSFLLDRGEAESLFQGGE